MLVRGAFNLLFRPGLRKDFRDNYQAFETQWTDIVKAGTTNQVEISATIMAGLNRLSERGDGDPFIFSTPKIGPKVMAVDKEFAGGYMITKKAVEDDQYSKLKTGAKQLAYASQMTKEFRVGGFLDDAFTGTYYKGIDSLSLMHATHTLIGNTSSTVANKLSTAVGLSVTSVTSFMDLAGNLKDENGDPMRCWPTKLIIGNDAGNMNKALQIFGSDREPFTANNQDNAIKKRMGGIKIVQNVFMTNPRWYFFVDEKYNDAHLDVRRSLEVRDWYDEDISAMKVSASERYMLYFVDWRGWFGINPT